MSDNRNDDDRDPRLLTGAYSVDALSHDEAEEFERALLGADGSESLRRETDELQETAAVLGLAATPVAPSAALKASLFAKLGDTPQLPREHPVTVQDAPRASSEPVAPVIPLDTEVPTAAPAGAGDTSVTPAAPAAAPAPGATTTETGPAARRAERRWFARPAGVLTAVAAAAALFVGGGFVGSALVNQAPVVSDTSASALAELTLADDAQRATVPLSDGGTATVMWSNELGRSAVMADGLPALPDGKVYEAWYIDAEGAVPAGTFTAAASGTSWHVLDGAMKSGDTVGVTVEPAGGSTSPTTDPILVVQSA